MNILVVEDEKNLNEAMCHILEEHGSHTKAANDGKNGYELAGTNEYDLVLMDFMLPEMDGMEAVSRLRNDCNATPLIMVTAKVATSYKI